ncbi:hypothetical protein NDU88_003233 [Pleurodeles waltl]|uniref:Uncharacterized protein n=1 Tax=Pleurodeles waltl TaxID=8319 RepID=A0AAV7M6H8_PLEWA|nr:hypothetical protein NDU88_003233 [Pleurodeles waltl]
MEETPQGTFQDELEWCIRQLETGLMLQNPTPQQVGDTHRILKVLRSRKAPFVKKRQVMNQVFGDYRQKMAKERQKVEKNALKTSSVLIQECNSQTSSSIIYRKHSSEPAENSGNWFAPTDNSFRFSFSACEEDQENISSNFDKFQSDGNSDGKGAACAERSPDLRESETSTLNWSKVGNSRTEFNFNFLVQEEAELQDKDFEAQNVTSRGLLLTEQEGRFPQNDGCKDQMYIEMKKDISVPEMISSASQNDKKPAKTTDGVPKRKKKKRVPSEKELEGTEAKKESQSGENNEHGDEQLRREVDWCIEQLELGLKRQRSTQNQADEVLRAVKILRSEKAALVKKRQIMRSMLGDYRKKMEEERGRQMRLLQAATKAARVTEVREEARKTSSHVYRKCTKTAQKDHATVGSQDHFVPQECSRGSTSSPFRVREEGISDSNRFIFKSSEGSFCFNFF